MHLQCQNVINYSIAKNAKNNKKEDMTRAVNLLAAYDNASKEPFSKSKEYLRRGSNHIIPLYYDDIVESIKLSEFNKGTKEAMQKALNKSFESYEYYSELEL
jgi:hypothetical protein